MFAKVYYNSCTTGTRHVLLAGHFSLVCHDCEIKELSA